jgi:uncharacterized membrane protein
MLVGLSVVPALAGAVRLGELASHATVTAANARFIAMPLPAVLHLLAVVPFSVLGAFQFLPPRSRSLRWHRGAGLALVLLGLVAALSGLWMTMVYPWPQYDGEALYLLRLVFGSGMVLSIVLGTDALRRRDFLAHAAWMTRGYAIGMGAGTQVLTLMPYALLVGQASERTRATLMGAGWVINVIVAEWAIRARSLPDHAGRRQSRLRPCARGRATPSFAASVGATSRISMAPTLVPAAMP